MDLTNYLCVLNGQCKSIVEVAAVLGVSSTDLYEWVLKHGPIINTGSLTTFQLRKVSNMIEFEEKLLSIDEIAELLNCSKNSVTIAINKYIQDNGSLKGFSRAVFKYNWKGKIYSGYAQIAALANCSTYKVRMWYEKYGNCIDFDPAISITKTPKISKTPVVWRNKTFDGLDALSQYLGYSKPVLYKYKKENKLDTLNRKDPKLRGRSGTLLVNYANKDWIIADLAAHLNVSRWSIEDHARKGHDLNTVKWRRSYSGKIKVQYKGKTYNSIKQCADKNKLSPMSLYTWWRNNGKCRVLDKYTERFNKYEYNGRGYKSIREVAQAANTSTIAATKYHKTFGTFEGFHERYYPVNKRIPFTYKGVNYKSVRECCLAHGLNYSASVARLRTCGQLERIYPEFRVEYDGMIYTSKKALADKLGCHATTITYYYKKYGNLDKLKFFKKRRIKNDSRNR